MCVRMWVSLLVFLGQAVVVEDATCSLDGRLADYADYMVPIRDMQTR